ncbi:BON domain-containing protein [Burkholderia sp. PAMC 26561]|uniref:BON domain-containing protein n=1 Tax=Burkholderia sp. PAMC 26561 TaxID=1795043 RepID=UPI001F42A8CD|nr:BON domain-containing protein [Burkholderia sp. PAMC 26561]
MAFIVNDSELQQAVLSELAWEPSVTAAHVGVTAASIVTLTGTLHRLRKNIPPKRLRCA